MTDTERLPDPIPAILRLPRGTTVILRHYDAPDRDKIARDLAQICRRNGLFLTVAGDAGLAHRVGASGLHLPQGQLWHGLSHKIFAWRAGHPERRLSATAHDPLSLARARRFGVDFVLLSPIFPTASHPGAPTVGAVRLALWLRRYGIGVGIVALGGVDQLTARRLAGTGIAGLAGIGGIVMLSRTGRRYRF